MLKGFGNFAAILKQAQAIKSGMSEMQDRLSKTRVQGSAGGGMVTVEVNGKQTVLGVHIEPSLFESGDREMLEDLLVAATNQALEKSAEAAAQEMERLTGDFDLSGALSQLGLGGGPGE
jgi:DNA-binding YbaB/EbfC family protein